MPMLGASRAMSRATLPCGEGTAMAETRKLAAILAADVVGYSRLAGSDEDRTLARLRGLRSDLIDPTIALHHGRVVKRTGDGILIEFRSVVDAVRCAMELQNGMVERNAGLPPDRRIEFRVGTWCVTWWGFDTRERVLFPGGGFAYSHYHEDGHCGLVAEEAVSLGCVVDDRGPRFVLD
jgi:hypothetical protein